ncbi:2-phospho-L-lactate guanylyltransferase [Oerskovia turbata]
MTPDDAARPTGPAAAGAPPVGQRVVAVVPLRDGFSGKTRLATVLDPGERSRLIATLARHVVGTLLASEAVERVLVVTSDPRFTWRALGSLVAPTQTTDDAPHSGTATATDDGDGDPGRLQIVLQPASRPGLNAALDVGREIIAGLAAVPASGTSGATPGHPGRLLIAHADLPALTIEDVEALVAVDAPVVVATDRTRSGTNLLVLDGDAPFTFRFGVGSLDAHLAEADARGVRAVVVRRAGTAVDLDTLDDWSELPAEVRGRPDLSELHEAMDRCAPDHVSERA